MMRLLASLGQRAPRQGSVLIVTDTDAGRELAATLREAGLHTRCGAVLRLERMLADDVPDVVVIDAVASPELCSALRRPERPPLAIVAIVADPARRLAALRAGADHCACAPIDHEELLARIPWLIDARARHADLTADVDAARMWHDWIRYLVHDLRNPLTIATSYLALARLAAPGELHADLKQTERALFEVAGMLQDILDTDRIKHDALVLHRQTLDLGELARGAAAKTDGEGTIDVAVSGDATLEADPVLLSRVFVNLFANALRHANGSGVRVLITGGTRGVSARVCNPGPAIDPAIVPYLFEPWHRIDGATHATGIGLAFCRLVCEAHAGKIWLDDDSEGSVTFAFGLPRG